MKQKKTMTLGHDDNPSVSILPGFVGAREFCRAFKAEGWSPADVAAADLHYEYRLKIGRKYKLLKTLGAGRKPKSEKPPKSMTLPKGAKPYTVTYW